ncbi:unnamed protein product [Rotaria socialis]
MSAIPKSNIKRIRDILLADENRINNDVNDNQGSDFEHGDVVTVSQPETLKKNGVTCMSAIPKSNLKRIRDILLADENGINNDVNDNQGSDSDSESDFLATESDDTSNSEHISEESDLSNSDFEHCDVVT